MHKTNYMATKLSAFALLAVLTASCSNNAATHPPTQPHHDTSIHPETWPRLEKLPLDPAVEAKIDEILPKLTVAQKVGQIIQADSGSVTPADVKQYRLGSVLSGGNSAPGPEPYAATQAWLEMADKYYLASVDPDGVEIAIPTIWGIDAVHGHTNLRGAIIFPHNVGLGAMRNPDLIEKIAQITAQELTVSGHDWTFAPTLAVPQDIRWGRSYEGFSEDPEIVRSYADRIVYGLQGRLGDKDFMGQGRVISSAKHFVGDGGTKNGVDQGNAAISEAELRDVHGAGYYSSIPAGVQTVMASFSSWQGRKLHGDKNLLTDVLKEQLGFNGFVIGDWNGHGQVPGCTNTDCAQSFNAGVDMFMAPDSWKGLYESTLQHVKAGTIPMERLDDAVRRILRVKIASGMFEKGAPSTRPNAGDERLLSLPENREIARQAVRESLVLLKNNNGTLPIDASKTVMVIGDGANDIAKTAGGWTLSWQGGGYPNSAFPNAQSILDGIRETVKAAGGHVVFSPDGNTNKTADVIIAIYGEDPYAEFQGDRDHLDFVPNGFDVSALHRFQKQGIPVVSVFLSGRPMWVNPELNNSDAFIAAWLPGSEGGGVADMLFRTDPAYEFSGRLSFAWPGTAVVDTDTLPLFALGYGLNYHDTEKLATLSERSNLESAAAPLTNTFFAKGTPVEPWVLSMRLGTMTKRVGGFPTSGGGFFISKTDHVTQEDALRLKWTGENNAEEELRLASTKPMDFSRQAACAMHLAFAARSFADDTKLRLGMGCKANGACDKSVTMTILPGDWRDYHVSLARFTDQGVDMSKLDTAIAVSPVGEGAVDIGIGNIRLEAAPNGPPTCMDQ